MDLFALSFAQWKVKLQYLLDFAVCQTKHGSPSQRTKPPGVVKQCPPTCVLFSPCPCREPPVRGPCQRSVRTPRPMPDPCSPRASGPRPGRRSTLSRPSRLTKWHKVQVGSAGGCGLMDSCY